MILLDSQQNQAILQRLRLIILTKMIVIPLVIPTYRFSMILFIYFYNSPNKDNLTSGVPDDSRITPLKSLVMNISINDDRFD
jgi:hypothetical protein